MGGLDSSLKPNPYDTVVAIQVHSKVSHAWLQCTAMESRICFAKIDIFRKGLSLRICCTKTVEGTEGNFVMGRSCATHRFRRSHAR